MDNNIVISPSLICADLCNLEREVKLLESAGLKHLHIDIIDPHFSPSMPIGLSTIKQLKLKTSMSFDIHIMSTINDFFINELVDIVPDSISFHYETTLHVEKMLQIIESKGIKTGIALGAATPISVLEYVVKRCDYVLLMLINPGYADGKGEEIISYALQKIKDCKEFLLNHQSKAKIIVDGRVSLDNMGKLIDGGAEILVAGSRSIFRKGFSYAENYKEVMRVMDSHFKVKR